MVKVWFKGDVVASGRGSVEVESLVEQIASAILTLNRIVNRQYLTRPIFKPAISGEDSCFIVELGDATFMLRREHTKSKNNQNP
jgi:hypothetical protein